MVIQSKAETEFILLDRIYDIQPNAIKGNKTFYQSPASLAIESCAQLGAFHIRFVIGFCRHVFLIRVKEYKIYPANNLHGSFCMTGACLSRSSDAFLYAIQITNNNETVNKGKFLFGVADYDKRFDKSRLTKHYQDIFFDLVNAKSREP